MSKVGAPTPHSRYWSLSSKARFAPRELLFLHGHWLPGK
jgi:hypothetical protein